uniref:Uncharacterized protein n=1 Tax=Chromera velia CCMP2878 TaxID=1169474 RepID=A0A0G4GE08_9ALVE|eukprot:Cvel_21485.t1-p1 / transcript=Cvel_21485.t1 / gene=Cvel_21485 / organism=Chromera_velia_CCMP2878 / gene_product=hypothetical protein / transcript_product=hypothetical protein / location=Cvel_scaffold2018:18681-19073(-) / protein_length=131 / sequence_SO=supercontig / SO=protein_coding / is_pseudo=false
MAGGGKSGIWVIRMGQGVVEGAKVRTGMAVVVEDWLFSRYLSCWGGIGKLEEIRKVKVKTKKDQADETRKNLIQKREVEEEYEMKVEGRPDPDPERPTGSPVIVKLEETPPVSLHPALTSVPTSTLPQQQT